MTMITIEGMSERVYPQHLVQKTIDLGLLGKTNVITIAEENEKYDIHICIPLEQLYAVLQLIFNSESIGDKNEKVKVVVPINASYSLTVEVPGWMVANMIIGILTTHELNQMCEVIKK